MYSIVCVIEKGGVKIGFFGLNTPESATKVNPANIKGLTFLNDNTTTTWKEDAREIGTVLEYLNNIGYDEDDNTSHNAYELTKRPNVEIKDILEYLDNHEFEDDVINEVQIEIKYEGYILRQQAQINETLRLESKAIPDNINYDDVYGLRLEAKEKLNKVRPANIGQASRISGVSPSDISVLLIYLRK